MSIALSLDRQQRRYHALVTGSVSMDEMHALYRRQVNEGIFGYSALVDARHADLQWRPSEIGKLVDLLEHLSAGYPMGPRAVVADSPATFGAVWMMATLAERFTPAIHVVRTMEEGAEWLGWPSIVAPEPFVRWT